MYSGSKISNRLDCRDGIQLNLFATPALLLEGRDQPQIFRLRFAALKMACRACAVDRLAVRKGVA
jgi:hypothetical protein